MPVLELNQLEMEFLLINDFDLHISVEEIQETGDLLLRNALKYPLKITVNPTNDLKISKSNYKQNPSSQKQQSQSKSQSQTQPQKDVPVPPRIHFNEAEESNRRISLQVQSQNNNNHYNIQFNNSPVPLQPKRATSYDEYNKEFIESTAAAIDAFDGEPLPNFTTLNNVTSMNNHCSPAPNVYTLTRTTSKNAAAKIRNSMMSNNNNNNNPALKYNANNGSRQNSNYSNSGYSYNTPQSSQPPQQQNHPMRRTPPPIPQSQSPHAVLMDSQYSMYEDQQKQQQRYNESKMNNSGQRITSQNYYVSPELSEGMPIQNNMMNNGPNNYNTGDMKNNVNRLSISNNQMGYNANMPVYDQHMRSRSNSSLNAPPNMLHKVNSNNNINGIPHSANDYLYNKPLPQQSQQISGPPQPMAPLYNNSPNTRNNNNNNNNNNRMSVNNVVPTPYSDSPLDAPPRLTKFFGYKPNEIISPIRIADEQDMQKIDDMPNNFYLSPLNSQVANSPLIQSFTNLHIGSTPASSSNTQLRSYNSTSSINTPNGNIDPSANIPPIPPINTNPNNVSLSVSHLY